MGQSYLPARSIIVLALLGCVPLLAKSADAAQASTRFDGPAELPRVTVRSTLSDTPAPGKVHTVKEGDSLQQIVNGASCGDTVRLEAGATFSGELHLPPKDCDDSHWIIIRTDAPDSSLPPEGTRMTPCFAGIPSLPGRPNYPCPVPRNLLAKIVFEGRGGSAPVLFSPGANHYRLLGLEITRGSPGANISSLISLYPRVGPNGKLDSGRADHLVFDRLWVHGTAHDETTRGLLLGGSTYVAVVDSYFSDLHCIAGTGACTDAQAVSGGTGDNPMGPYKIVNNFLEASGEVILFGGAGGTATPADIEIRRNHLFRPLLWKPGQPGFIAGNSGHPFIVKNIFELKNAQRLLLENNILDYSWGGFSQTGFAILLTPKNQGGGCPACKVTDITLRYNKISHSASGIQIVNGPDNGAFAAAGERYSIHDLVFRDIDDEAFQGFGALLLLSSSIPVLRDVSIDHITAFLPKMIFNLGIVSPYPKIANFSFTNNLLQSGPRGDLTSTGGGRKNCAFVAEARGVAAEDVLKSCFTNYTVTHNVILNATASWPSGNFLPKSAADAGLPSSSGPRNVRLCRREDKAAGCKKASPFLHAGTDGKPVGADVDAIDDATAGVE